MRQVIAGCDCASAGAASAPPEEEMTLDLFARDASRFAAWLRGEVRDASGNPVYTQRVYDAPGCENNPNRVGGYYWYGAGTTGRNNKLWVDDGFTDCTQILYNVTAQYAGNSMIYGQDYVFYPANAKAQGRPYNEVQFYFGLLGGLPQSIVLTAKFGYCDSLPIDVAQAIIKRTAAGLMPHIEILQLGDAQTIQALENERFNARRQQEQEALRQQLQQAQQEAQRRQQQQYDEQRRRAQQGN